MEDKLTPNTDQAPAPGQTPEQNPATDKGEPENKLTSEKKQTLRKVTIILTSIFFSIYSLYNVYIIIKDGNSIPPVGILISGIVALAFGVFVAYVATAGVSKQDAWFQMIRRSSFTLAFLVIFILKMRMLNKVVDYFEFIKFHTYLYSAAYCLTQAALLILFVYYVFFRRLLPFFPRLAVVLPVSAIVLFICSLLLEVLLYVIYGVGLEYNPLRTILIRPIFYFGFIGLSAYFMFPLQRTPSRAKMIARPSSKQS